MDISVDVENSSISVKTDLDEYCFIPGDSIELSFLNEECYIDFAYNEATGLFDNFPEIYVVNGDSSGYNIIDVWDDIENKGDYRV